MLTNCLIIGCAHIAVVKKGESIHHNHKWHLFFSMSASLLFTYLYLSFVFFCFFSLREALQPNRTVFFFFFYVFHLAAVSLISHPLSCSETPWQHFRGRLSLPSLWPVSIFCAHTHNDILSMRVTAVCLCMLTTSLLFDSLSLSVSFFGPFFLPFPLQGDRRRAFWRHCSQGVLQWGWRQVNAP